MNEETNDSGDTEDQSRDKRQRVLASRPDQQGTDVNADMCKTIVLAAGPEDRDGWTQQENKSGHLGLCLNHRR